MLIISPHFLSAAGHIGVYANVFPYYSYDFVIRKRASAILTFASIELYTAVNSTNLTACETFNF